MSQGLARMRTILQIHAQVEKPYAGMADCAANLGISFLRTPRWREAQSYYRAYPLLAVLIEVGSVNPELLAEIAELRSVPPETDVPPLLCLANSNLNTEDRRALAEAGIDVLIDVNDPARFVIYQIELLKRMAELKRFENSQSGVKELAKRTRETLHDLSQPLSAVQGRLQLIAVKCGDDDPNKKYYEDLVRQVFEITNHVIKIQQIQRDAV